MEKEKFLVTREEAIPGEVIFKQPQYRDSKKMMFCIRTNYILEDGRKVPYLYRRDKKKEVTAHLNGLPKIVSNNRAQTYVELNADGSLYCTVYHIGTADFLDAMGKRIAQGGK